MLCNGDDILPGNADKVEELEAKAEASQQQTFPPERC